MHKDKHNNFPTFISQCGRKCLELYSPKRKIYQLLIIDPKPALKQTLSHSEQADLSHELLGGEDQLVVDEPAGLLLEQTAVGVDVNRLLVLHGLVAAFAQSRRVIEISCRHRLGEEKDGGRAGLSPCWVGRSTTAV